MIELTQPQLDRRDHTRGSLVADSDGVPILLDSSTDPCTKAVEFPVLACVLLAKDYPSDVAPNCFLKLCRLVIGEISHRNKL